MRSRSSFILSRSLAAGACGAAAIFAAAVFAAAKTAMIVLPIEDAKFMPVDASRPQMAQHAVLRGDPATGPSSTLLRFGRAPATMHVHSADYDLVLLKGTMKHWAAGQSEADARLLQPGSYWFQPANEPHAGVCLSDECLMYVQWSGKRDARLAQ
jgi:quercetin dioxygenase-like cupin family protein